MYQTPVFLLHSSTTSSLKVLYSLEDSIALASEDVATWELGDLFKL